MNCPCRGCRERTEDCHGSCGRYREYRHIKDAIRLQRKAEGEQYLQWAESVERRRREYREHRERRGGNAK